MTISAPATAGGIDNFNSHAHVERDISAPATAGGIDNFNSHAHVERDAAVMGGQRSSSISTHTLTWSVTPFLSLFT